MKAFTLFTFSLKIDESRVHKQTAQNKMLAKIAFTTQRRFMKFSKSPFNWAPVSPQIN